MYASVRHVANLARLNARVLGHVLSGRWVRSADVAAGYDRAAASYDEAWLVHLAGTTRRVVEMMPSDLPNGGLLDLGCGTGFGTELLTRRYAGREVEACDISSEMLSQATAKVGTAHTRFHRADMIGFLQQRPARSVAGVLSAWSVGYADWRTALAECGRVLVGGGALGVVVNLADTLPTVRAAFRHAMRQCPEAVRLACRPTFPCGASAMRSAILGAGLRITYGEDGWADAPVGTARDGDVVDHLLRTGILAGFDAMLPLDQPGPAREAFSMALASDARPVRHHYFAAVAVKP